MKIPLTVILVSLFTFSASAEIRAFFPGVIYGNDAFSSSGEKLNKTVGYSLNIASGILEKVIIQTENKHSTVTEKMELHFSVNSKRESDIFLVGADLYEGPVRFSIKSPKATEQGFQVGDCKFILTQKKGIAPKAGVQNSYVVKCSEGEATLISAKGEKGSIQPVFKWAGDLNEDGIPDFLIDFDPERNGGTSSLYLSEKMNGQLKFKELELQHQGC